MKRITFVLSLLFASLLCRAELNVKWGSPLPSNSAWKGETINAVIEVSSSLPVKELTLKSGDLVCGTSVIDASRVGLNFISLIAGEELLEQYNQCGARDTVNYKAVYVPDMIDDRASVSLGTGQKQSVWMSINIPQNAVPGKYRGSLSFCEGEKVLAKLDYSVRVAGRVLPPLSESPFHLDLWQNPYAVARFHNVPLWSEEHFKYMKPVMKMLSDAGQKVITATIMDRPWNGQTEDPFGPMVTKIKRIDGSWLYDYTVFDKWVEFMMSLGIDGQINCYTLIPWALSFDYFDQATDQKVYIHAEPGSSLYEEYWGSFIKDFAAHLRSKGWFEKTYLAMDERSEESMKAALQLIRSVVPGFKVALAGSYNESIADEIDDLCIGFADGYPEGVVEARRAKGQISTYYTCCAEKYPNTFIASNPLEASWLPLVSLSRNIDGYLRWAYNSWTENPKKDARFRTWAAGDCYIVYPGGISSVRFERMKEGLQDYQKASILLEEYGRGSRKGAAIESALRMFTKDELDLYGPERALNALRKAMDR
ncbi:MAG: DUF4091 domain-containing protein [Bacteroidales bacterium]|nr:DUF4091 domain-containing protein [Candidatus Cryptobacteroides equifaecalis]